MENTLLSVTELAAALNVDRSTVHRRISRGELIPFDHVGNRPVFRREDLPALTRGEQTLTQRRNAA